MSDERKESLIYHDLYDIEERKNESKLNLNQHRAQICLTWRNVTYSVQIKDAQSKRCRGPKRDKIILRNVSGSAKPGQLLAIMGPSGSGKSTLLNVLSTRCIKTKGAKLSGTITVNGINKKELGQQRFSMISAYVQQDGVLYNMQTVKETLLNAARLRLPRSMSRKEKAERVAHIMQALGLKKAADTKIGDARNKGISGGEKKRTNIAIEMIQDPSILFLDEPTTNLDAFQAFNVMETLKILSMGGVTVIVSIHQPRSAIYKLFDRLLLLSEGRVAYSGEAGHVAVNYFSNLGYKCPVDFQSADYFLDIISVNNRSKIQESKSEKRIEFILNAYKEYEAQHLNDLYLDDEYKGRAVYTRDDVTVGVTSGICEQFAVLATRNLRQITRDVLTLRIRLFMSCFFALFISALWYDVGTAPQDIQNRNGILFFVATNQSFVGLMSTLKVFTVERIIVRKERHSHCYYLWVYYFTKLITQLPVDVFIPSMFASIVYWIVGLNPDPVAFITFVFLTVLISLSAVGVGFMVGSFAPTMDAAMAIAPLMLALTILFGGFYINSGSLPVWLSWFENMSTIRWCFEAYCINEYRGLEFCDEEGQCQSGEDVLKLLSFNPDELWMSTLCLVGLLCAMHLIAFSCLKFVTVQYMECDEGKANEGDYVAKAHFEEIEDESHDEVLELINHRS